MQSSDETIEIPPTARRCAVCHTGRRWRQFEVVRGDDHEPVLVCAACRTRYPAAAAPVAPPPAPVAAPTPQPNADSPEQQPAPSEDRLKKALRELPHGEHSVARIAKAAGLNHAKTLRRLHALQGAGEVQQVGSRWSNEPPSTDIEAAMDRLQARTSNLRIIK